MDEKHKITINLSNRSIDIEGTDKMWVEGNVDKFLKELDNINGKIIMNQVRLFWCGIYLFVGAILISIFLLKQSPDLNNLVKDNLSLILLCVGCSSIGISLGLWNSRNNKNEKTLEHLHYITYFIFVLIIASLGAFVAYFSASGVASYARLILTAIVIGFAGDSLAGAILKLSK